MSNYRIKIIAVVLMLMDHIYGILGSIYNVPIFFTWLGRLSAPLFFYMTAEGMYHTKNPKKMLSRLYIASVCMEVLKFIYNSVKPEYGYYVRNGIFQTLFLVALYIFFIQKFREEHTKKGRRKIILWMCLPLIINALVLVLVRITTIPILKYVMIILPMPLYVEGSLIFIILGVFFFIHRDSRVNFIMFYCFFSTIFLLPAIGDLSIQNIFYENFQWMMIFSLPIMLSYNGKKGRNMKYLFYVFYPLHISILVMIQLFAAR